MKQPNEMGGYPEKLIEFVFGTASATISSIIAEGNFNGMPVQLMKDSVALLVAMCLNCWDAGQGNVEIGEVPSEERMKMVHKMMGKTSGKFIIEEIKSEDIAKKLGEILGNKEVGQGIADNIQKLIQDKIGGEIDDKDIPSWDPHEA